jgi:hypothetical protein
VPVEELVSSNGNSGGPSMEPASKTDEVGAKNLDVKGDMLKPSLANNNWVRPLK